MLTVPRSTIAVPDAVGVDGSVCGDRYRSLPSALTPITLYVPAFVVVTLTDWPFANPSADQLPDGGALDRRDVAGDRHGVLERDGEVVDLDDGVALAVDEPADGRGCAAVSARDVVDDLVVRDQVVCERPALRRRVVLDDEVDA